MSSNEVVGPEQLQNQWQSVMLPNYGTPKILIESGQGSYVTDSQGRTYLDLLAGIAVSSLGHSHPSLVAAIQDQATKLLHTSNLYAHQPALDLASKLLELADSQGRVMFAQDGATANEAALKLARRHGLAVAPDGSKQVFVATNNGFHGRTMGALAVTGNTAKREPFGPFPYEVRFVDYGDIAQLTAAMDSSVCAVILEPIQGEGGINVPPPNYLEVARTLATDHNAVMIVDEVQSGIGRTGDWFMSHAQGVRPDIITLAKGLAGGLPLGAMIVEPAFTQILKPGDHGTTFGGNPVSCRAALAVIETIEAEELLAHVALTADYLFSAINSVSHPEIAGVRGKGLWLAIGLRSDSASAVEAAALESGYLVNAVKPNAIRLAPPLNITREELATFVNDLPSILDRAVR